MGMIQQKYGIVDLERRIIQHGGLYSFQIYNILSGNVLWSSPFWRDTEEEATTEYEKVRELFINELRQFGFVLYKLPNGREGYGPQGAQMPSPQIIMTALAFYKQLGKYSFVVTTTNGDIIFKPQLLVDTPAEAMALAKRHKSMIVDECTRRGYGRVRCIDPQAEDFEPPTDAASVPTGPQDPPPQPPTKKLFPVPTHLDPSAN